MISVKDKLLLTINIIKEIFKRVTRVLAARTNLISYVSLIDYIFALYLFCAIEYLLLTLVTYKIIFQEGRLFKIYNCLATLYLSLNLHLYFFFPWLLSTLFIFHRSINPISFWMVSVAVRSPYGNQRALPLIFPFLSFIFPFTSYFLQ